MKEFFISSWAITNRTSVYILTVLVTLFGISTYNSLPKEQYPDIVIPTMYVATLYPGTSPTDMENLVTRPIEKQLKSISGVKKITSNSIQDFSSIVVEFNTDVDVAIAKQKVKDAVDKSRPDLPNDLPRDPDVIEVDFSEFPIMYVNVSGDVEPQKLKDYTKIIQDKIETLKEITRADMVGALDKEVQVNVDMYKLQAANVTFNDIERAIASENLNLSGGTIRVGDMKRSVQVFGEYKDARQIGNIIVKSLNGSPIYLREIAEVVETFEEKESFARLDGESVITLNVIKRSGENLVEAADKIRTIVEETVKNDLPSNIKVTITGDMSVETRTTLSDLINSIILGFIFVTLVLMFFMGTTNALFVGLSVPLASFLTFLILPAIGYSLNMIVLFSFLLALGIVVDDAIVVIENTHRIYHNSHKSILESARLAAGEVFIPVLAGTATTVAPFIPLAFWSGLIGEFMVFLPVTLMLTLTASLIVAFLINPVFAVDFMKRDHEVDKAKSKKMFLISCLILSGLGVLFYFMGHTGFILGNLMMFFLLGVLINRYVFTGAIKYFQDKMLPALLNGYSGLLKWATAGKRPWMIMIGMVVLFFCSIVLLGVRSPKVVFFPQGDPNFAYVYLVLPTGTDQTLTDSLTQVVENRVNKVVGENNPVVESIISNVAIGAGDPQNPDRSAMSHKGKVTVAFVEFEKRHGESTEPYLNKIREAVKDIPGVEITVDKEQGGPPVSKPILIEITGENLNELIPLSEQVERYVDSLQIPGIEDLKSDFETSKPEIVIDINRERANQEGISTAQIGMEIRTAIFGREVSNFRKNEDEFPIQVRYSEQYRKNIDALMDLKISFLEMTSGQRRQIPLSSLATVRYQNSYGGITRKNLKRVITISSNVITGFNENEVVNQINAGLKSYKVPVGFEVKMGGQQEEQAETAAFLGNALLLALGLIFLILVTQFNSLSKPLIILSEIIFSIIGVFLGFAITGMEISIIMTGVGIVALAGIVVKNGILLVEFTDVLQARGMSTRRAIVEAGRTRLNPVLLTATATMLGLVPLGIGMNFNFLTLFSELDPHFFLGGQNAVFWGPLAWTIIFGLGFATLVTLVVVPVMYLLNHKFRVWRKRKLRIV
ncbi:MAG: efflux RND transporter permease subunit [Sphingobacteriia bacterium]|nr:efflux RND transporter permease subunit [Sphingobacteriia bacterium]